MLLLSRRFPFSFQMTGCRLLVSIKSTHLMIACIDPVLPVRPSYTDMRPFLRTSEFTMAKCLLSNVTTCIVYIHPLKFDFMLMNIHVTLFCCPCLFWNMCSVCAGSVRAVCGPRADCTGCGVARMRALYAFLFFCSLLLPETLLGVRLK